MEIRKSALPGPVDFAQWLQTPEQERWEILEGEPCQMSAAPLEVHQKVVMNLQNEFFNYLRGKDCVVRTAPYAVRLFTDDKSDEEVKTVVQPDISIICDKRKIDEYGCEGAPDLVVEVLSESTAHIDRGLKLHLYKKAGVREYWLIDPKNESIEVYEFERRPDMIFATALYHKQEEASIRVGIFEDLMIGLSDIFA